jgi:hypothetical protein
MFWSTKKTKRQGVCGIVFNRVIRLTLRKLTGYQPLANGLLNQARFLLKLINGSIRRKTKLLTI